MKDKAIKLSVVIPSYNEEKIIRKDIKEVIKFLSKKKYLWEILIVDDGSDDATVSEVAKIKDKRVHLIKVSKNRGKGAALRKGMLQAHGSIAIFMDVDLSVPISTIDKFMNEFTEGEEVVVASRRVPGAEILIHQSFFRESMGRVFTYLSRIFTSTNLADYTCGFKGFSKGASVKIFGHSMIDRWAYDAEIMFLANKYGYNIKEVPVSWRNRGETRVRLRGAIVESLSDLVRIRINEYVGKYTVRNSKP